MKPGEILVNRMHAASSSTCSCLWKAPYLALTVPSNFKNTQL